MLSREDQAMIKSVFMLSSGRTGTGTFAHMLQQSRWMNAFHVPKPELIEEAFEVQQARGPAKAYIGPKIEAIQSLMRGHEDKIYVETNNKLYPFASELDQAFDARFFWVIRDPFEYVNSGLSRKWYTGAGGVWDTYREQPKKGWHEGTTQVQKIAWQWCEINSIIEAGFSKLKSARVYHFSDLRDDRDAVQDLVKWLGATDVSTEEIERVFGLRINVGRYSAPRDPETGDHVFGKMNHLDTEIHAFDHNEVRQVIAQFWRSPHSERYLS
jgi:hypothetical protein